MSENKTDMADFLEKGRTWPVVDVRTPAEFQRGHMPGAVNLPLFTNEERTDVGTLYLQKGSNEAILKGLEVTGPKLKHYTLQAYNLAPDGNILLYCWRGGMRSNSMSWLLNIAGMNSFTLEGGYKTYRRFVHAFFESPFNLVVIGGMTGSGKTAVLEEIERAGHQVVHLERLASHKGSVFGHLGMPEQPTTEQFENDLFTCLYAVDAEKPVFVEDESLAIGRVFIPRPFYNQMSSGVFIHLVVPFEIRVKRLIETYTVSDREWLVAGVRKIERRLGKEAAGRAIDFILEGNMENAVETVLRYYDKVYKRGMGMHQHRENIEIEAGIEDAKELSNKIADKIGKQIAL